MPVMRTSGVTLILSAIKPIKRRGIDANRFCAREVIPQTLPNISSGVF